MDSLMATDGWSGEAAPAVAGDDMSIVGVVLTSLGSAVAGLVWTTIAEIRCLNRKLELEANGVDFRHQQV